MEIPLKDIASIQFGYYSVPGEKGDYPFLQAGHFDDTGRLIDKVNSYVDLPEKDKSQLLSDGDVIFAGKGTRNFAYCYHSIFGQAVASSTFYILKPKQDIIFPEYLMAVLNLPQNRLQYRQMRSGVSIPSIRKSDLSEFKIKLIPLEQQKKVVALQILHLKEIDLLNNLIFHKKELHNSIITEILK